MDPWWPFENQRENFEGDPLLDRKPVESGEDVDGFVLLYTQDYPGSNLLQPVQPVDMGARETCKQSIVIVQTRSGQCMDDSLSRLLSEELLYSTYVSEEEVGGFADVS